MLEFLLTDSAVVDPKTNSQDAAGGQVRTPTTPAPAPLKCLLQQGAGPAKATVQGQPRGRAAASIFFGADPNCKANGLVTVTRPTGQVVRAIAQGDAFDTSGQAGAGFGFLALWELAVEVQG